jgi:flagellar basal body-associated protein FliL
MAQNLINRTDPGETPGIEGQIEAGAEPDTGNDVKPGSRRCLRKHEKVIAGLVSALFIFLVVCGLKHWHAGPWENGQKVTSTRVYKAPITGDDSGAILDLAPFIILLPEDEDRAYFSLSISLKPSNSHVCREIEKKKTFFRGVIYEILNRAVKTCTPKMVPKEELKRDIIGALNRLLTIGTIDDVYLTKFLVV